MALTDNPWTTAELETLAQLWAEGHTTLKIARTLRRTKFSVIGKAHRLHLDGRPNPSKPGMIDWTDERLDRLRAMYADGHSCAAIGAALGISKSAIIGKVNRLGLPKPPREIKPRTLPARPKPLPLVSFPASQPATPPISKNHTKSSMPATKARPVSVFFQERALR